MMTTADADAVAAQLAMQWHPEGSRGGERENAFKVNYENICLQFRRTSDYIALAHARPLYAQAHDIMDTHTYTWNEMGMGVICICCDFN